MSKSLGSAKQRFRFGMRVPDFNCNNVANPNFNFYSTAGRCVILSFYGSTRIERSRDVIQFICNDLRHLLDEEQAIFFGVSIDKTDKAKGVRDVRGIRFFWDLDTQVSKLYGAVTEDSLSLNQGNVPYKPFTLLLDKRLRVARVIPFTDATTHNNELKHSLESLLEEEEKLSRSTTAPVLVVPRIFDRQFCNNLIAYYTREGGDESGQMVEKDGMTVRKIDHSFKRRNDCQIRNKEIVLHFHQAIMTRLVPEIEQAFHFRVEHIERYIVSCYDSSSGGFFNAHRDNTTKGTAHRRFACTINLNAEDYEGGDLRFPEFGPRTYRAPTGGAVVFSGSLLHEALPVTSGTRFATLPFLHDQAAEDIRQHNISFLSKETIRV